MAGATAAEHGLDGKLHDMRRRRQRICVLRLVVDEREIVRAVHAQKVAKGKVAQGAARIGRYPSEVPDTTVAVRVDLCPNAAEVR